MKYIATLILVLLTTAAPADARDFAVSVGSHTEGEDVIADVAVAIPIGHYLYAERFKVEVESPEGVTLSPHNVPKPKTKQDPILEEKVAVYEESFTASYKVIGYVEGDLKLKVSYQGCDTTTCYLPASENFSFLPETRATAEPWDGKLRNAALPDTAETAAVAADWHKLADSFAVAGRAVGYVKPELFLAFLRDPTQYGTGGGAFAGKAMWLSLVLIVLGGLALNLTPCVLPMIPINLAIIGAGAQAGSKGRGFALGAVYGTGIAVAYGLLGLVVVLTGSTFGTLNASPWFNFAIAALFVVMALAMFGKINIDFSRFQRQGRTGGPEQKKGGFAVAFGIGVVAALLAGACVAPVLISVLLWASDLYARGHAAGLLLPFLLGVGMALPWPFAGAGLSLLPKPGSWMDWVKYAFGILILGMAIYYGTLGAKLLVGDRTPAVTATIAKPDLTGWHTSLESGFAEAIERRKPVFIDFWASWCKNCIAMDRSTFKDPMVDDMLQGFVKIKYQAEVPSEPATKAVLDQFGVLGLPTYVILQPNPDISSHAP